MEAKLRMIYPSEQASMQNIMAYSKILKKYNKFPLSELLDTEDFVDCKNWENHNNDMISLSTDLSDIVFCLDIIDGHSVGTKFFLSGKTYQDSGTITFPKFDKTKFK